MILDRYPRVTDSDIDIAWWAYQNLAHLPKVYVQLGYAIRPKQEDVALVHFDTPDWKVERIRLPQAGDSHHTTREQSHNKEK